MKGGPLAKSVFIGQVYVEPSGMFPPGTTGSPLKVVSVFCWKLILRHSLKLIPPEAFELEGSGDSSTRYALSPTGQTGRL